MVNFILEPIYGGTGIKASQDFGNAPRGCTTGDVACYFLNVVFCFRENNISPFMTNKSIFSKWILIQFFDFVVSKLQILFCPAIYFIMVFGTHFYT
jgi:hypothetical protein